MNYEVDDMLLDKLNKLKCYLKELGSVAVAFSGGVDSALLLMAAKEALGDKAVAITAVSVLIPSRETREACDFCREYGIRHIVITSDPLSIEGFKDNPKNRCYICKKSLFRDMLDAAVDNGIDYLAEGSNVDDECDYRPGLKAILELDVKSPLRYAGLTKKDIRALSRYYNLSTWNKPSYACLASRFVYGEAITADKLKMIDMSEQYLYDLGFRGMRVRIHNDAARIELPPDDIDRFMQEEIRLKVHGKLRELGFNYVSLDLKGYSMGSMNVGI